MLIHPSDLSAGQLWHYRSEFDLHVARVVVDGPNAAVVVTEYEFPLHVSADAWLDVEPVTA